MVPGQMQLIRIPFDAHSPAAARTIAITAPFDAAYAATPGTPTRPAIDAVTMIEPPPARSRWGMPYFMPNQTPRMLTAVTRSKVASGQSRTLPSSPPTPALL